MTQFQHTLKALLEGRKMETSRIVKPNEYTWICGERSAPWNEHGVTKLYSQVIAETQTSTSMRQRTAWEVGKDYAIEPHRGVRSVGRYRVEAIWKQDVRTLTPEQVKAEGFIERYDFWLTWCEMHDKQAFDITAERGLTHLSYRPAERYQACRMTIQVLWPTVRWD